MRTLIVPLLFMMLLASGCAGRGVVGSYCGPLPEGDAVSVIAADAVDCLSSLYPPGHTGLHLVLAKNVENGFAQAFERSLRGKGFTLHPETTAEAVAVAYTLDALFEKGEERAWYLQLRIFDSKTGGISIARAYTASGQPEAGQSRTETALKRSILKKAADTTRNALSE